MQDVLVYSYIFLAIAAFWFWVSGILSLIRMLRCRKPGRPLFRVVTTGLFNQENFTVTGNIERQKLLSAIRKFMGSITGLVIIVFIGIQTEV